MLHCIGVSQISEQYFRVLMSLEIAVPPRYSNSNSPHAARRGLSRVKIVWQAYSYEHFDLVPGTYCRAERDGHDQPI